jgi:hypothetical protein
MCGCHIQRPVHAKFMTLPFLPTTLNPPLSLPKIRGRLLSVVDCHVKKPRLIQTDFWQYFTPNKDENFTAFHPYFALAYVGNTTGVGTVLYSIVSSLVNTGAPLAPKFNTGTRVCIFSLPFLV